MSIVIGAALTEVIAANASEIQDGFADVMDPPFGEDEVEEAAGGNSRPQLAIDTVTNQDYERYLEVLGGYRYAIIGAPPLTTSMRVLALGKGEAEVREALDIIPLSELDPSLSFTADNMTFGAIKAYHDRVLPAFKSMNVIQIGDHNPQIGFDRPKQPKVVITWDEALLYALLHGCRLPTVDQMIEAAMVYLAVDGRPSGMLLQHYATRTGDITTEDARYAADAPADVDDPRYPPLRSGLRHVAGNVMEWTMDEERSGENPYVKGYKFVIGGSWLDKESVALRADHIDRCPPGFKSIRLGFRLARPAMHP